MITFKEVDKSFLELYDKVSMNIKSKELIMVLVVWF